MFGFLRTPWGRAGGGGRMDRGAWQQEAKVMEGLGRDGPVQPPVASHGWPLDWVRTHDLPNGPPRLIPVTQPAQSGGGGGAGVGHEALVESCFPLAAGGGVAARHPPPPHTFSGPHHGPEVYFQARGLRGLGPRLVPRETTVPRECRPRCGTVEGSIRIEMAWTVFCTSACPMPL